MVKINEIITEIDSFLAEEKFNNKKYHKIIKDYELLEKEIATNQEQDVSDIFQKIKEKVTEIEKKKKKEEQYQQEKLEINLIEKTKLCKIVEDLIDTEDRALLYRLMEEAKKKWHKIDEVPINDKTKVNQRFFQATKKCEQKCSEYIEHLHGDKEDNYQKKLDLIKEFKYLLQQERQQENLTILKKEFQTIISQWKSIKYLPKDKEVINEEFKELLEQYNKKKEYLEKKRNFNEEEIINKKKRCILQLKELHNKVENNKLPWQKTLENLLPLHEKWNSLKLEHRSDSFPGNKNKKKLKEYYEVLENILSAYKHGREDIITIQKDAVEKIKKLLNEKRDLFTTTYEVIHLQKKLKQKDPLGVFFTTEENKTFRDLANKFFQKNQQEISAQKENVNSLFEKKQKIQQQLDEILKKEYHYQQLAEVKKLSDDFFKIKLPHSRKNNLIYSEFKKSLDHFYSKKKKKQVDFSLQNKKSLQQKKLLVFRLEKLLNIENDKEDQSSNELSNAKKLEMIFKMNQSKQNDKKNLHFEIQEIKKEWYEIKGGRSSEEKKLYQDFKKFLDHYYGKKKR